MAVAALTFSGFTVPASAQSRTDATLSATINGRPLDDVNRDKPLRLVAENQATVSIEVGNGSDEELLVRGIRLDGQVLGLTFFSYEARLDLVVPGKATETREFPVDLIDLGGQADGLLPARLALLDAKRQVVRSIEFPADVRGSLLSVYGLLSLAVAAITIVLLTTAIVRLGTQRTSSNPWLRSVRFGLPGLGLGLTVAFVLSSLRILSPTTEAVVRLVAVGGVGLFIAGYVAPGPGQSLPHNRHRGGKGGPPGPPAAILATVGRRLRSMRAKTPGKRDSPLRKATITRLRR